MDDIKKKSYIGNVSVSTTFYALVFLAIFDIAIGWVMMGNGFNMYTALPSWLPSAMIIIVAVLTIFIGYMVENYALVKKKAKR